jgi:hypothetical protein
MIQASEHRLNMFDSIFKKSSYRMTCDTPHVLVQHCLENSKDRSEKGN